MLASVSGFQMLRFGQFWLIFQITESPLALGYVGLANGIPAIVLNLFGGVAADKVDQRRLIMAAQSIIAVLIFVLATLTLLDVVRVWHILTMAFLAASVEAFGLTSVWIGSFILALALMFILGIFNTMQNTALQASLQMLVPDHIRGRVMGIYGMTYNIRPLGGMQAGALAGLITAPFSIAVGGLAVAIFAIGSALASRNVRQMNRLILEAEPVPTPVPTNERPTSQPAPSPADS